MMHKFIPKSTYKQIRNFGEGSKGIYSVNAEIHITGKTVKIESRVGGQRKRSQAERTAAAGAGKVTGKQA